MATINAFYNDLAAGYLFPEISRRARAFQEQNRGTNILRLGIGDTTQPLPPTVIKGLLKGVESLATKETYTGYGDEQGMNALRQAFVERYAKRGVKLDTTDVFISDGAKPDTANIQSIFGLDNVVAVQDPAYPVYVDTNVIAGRAGKLVNGAYSGLVYMPCNEGNGFFPELPLQKVDLIYICSPNNPTGAVATKTQLKRFVDYALQHQSVIIFDSAYASFITDPSLPRSIYEIEGAKKCAIEISSFSKEAGFTGVRLGWTIVPKELECEDGPAGKLNSLWNRRQTTMFNGASNIVQQGGLSIMSETGQNECKVIIDYYMNNVKLIREGLTRKGFQVFGGINAPYIWLKTPGQMKSWDFFDKLLKEAHVVGTPGSGFGPSGEGYFRLSGFGHAEATREAIQSIQDHLEI